MSYDMDEKKYAAIVVDVSNLERYWDFFDAVEDLADEMGLAEPLSMYGTGAEISLEIPYQLGNRHRQVW